MLDFSKKIEDQGRTIKIYLKGQITETTRLEEILDPSDLAAKKMQTLQINLRLVDNINSHGVTIWLKYFNSLALAGKKLRFAEISPSIMRTISLIGNFLCGGTVQSILVPYQCLHCRHDFVVRYPENEIHALIAKLPDTPSVACTHCQRESKIDEIPEEYFDYFIRAGSQMASGA